MSADQAVAGVRPAVAALAPSAIREVAHLAMARGDAIALHFGESDIETPAFIRDAAARALAEGDTFYQPNRGIPALREALARYVSDLHGAALGPETITVTVSGLNGLMVALQCLVEAGDRVVATGPLWPNLTAIPRILGADVRTVPLEPEEAGWRLDLDRLLAACDDSTRVLLINSPSNPTGWMMRAEAQRAVLDFARARGIWIVADEVYTRIVYDGADAAPSFLSIAAPEDRVIVVNSFSKAWAMTGWRLGWLTAPASLGPTFEKMIEFNVSCPPGFVQRAGVVAVEQGEGFVAESRARYAAAREVLIERLSPLPRVMLPHPEAAFYGFFSVAGVDDTLAFAKRILGEAGVGLAPGEAFGPSGRGYLRVCYAIAPARLGTALDRLTPLLR